jgi:hypothetical protein
MTRSSSRATRSITNTVRPVTIAGNFGMAVLGRDGSVSAFTFVKVMDRWFSAKNGQDTSA